MSVEETQITEQSVRYPDGFALEKDAKNEDVETKLLKTQLIDNVSIINSLLQK